MKKKKPSNVGATRREKEKPLDNSNAIVALDLLSLSKCASVGIGVQASPSIAPESSSAWDQSDKAEIGSTPAVVYVSSDSSRYAHSEDDLAFKDLVYCQILSFKFEFEYEMLELAGDVEEPPKKKKRKSFKKSYEVTRRFQTEWAAEFPWEVEILCANGFIVQVKCSTYSDVYSKWLFMASK